MPPIGNTTIPEEIFWQILSYTPKECLPVFSLVSREWHVSVTPVLYRQVNLVWRRRRRLCYHSFRHRCRPHNHPSPCPCEHTGICKQNNHPGDHYNGRARPPCLIDVSSDPFETYPSLYLLVRTLIASPDRASSVRCLRLVGAVPSSVWIDPGQTGLTNHDRNRMQRILLRGTPTICSHARWMDELDKGSSSAYAAFLLVYLQRLETAGISAEFSQLCSFIGIATIRELRYLTKIAIGTFREEVYMAPSRVPSIQSGGSFNQLLIFYSPNVRHLSLNIPKPLANAEFEWPVMSLLPLTLGLESLELAYTFLNERDLAQVLRVCPRLRILKYDLWTTMEKYASPREALVDLDALEQALSPVKSTLESLHLHISKHIWHSGSWIHDWDHVTGELNFRDYPKLSTLHVPLRVFNCTREMDVAGMETEPSAMTSDLGTKLPERLTDLWMNLDGFDFPPEDVPGTPPMFREEELVQVISGFLNDWQANTPLLQSLKLLVYQAPYLVLEQWDPNIISDALVPRGSETGVDLSVDVVLYRCSPYVSQKGPFMRQLPPYFDQQIIDTHRVFEKGPNGNFE